MEDCKGSLEKAKANLLAFIPHYKSPDNHSDPDFVPLSNEGAKIVEDYLYDELIGRYSLIKTPKVYRF
jgi:hypothetical protein